MPSLLWVISLPLVSWHEILFLEKPTLSTLGYSTPNRAIVRCEFLSGSFVSLFPKFFSSLSLYFSRIPRRATARYDEGDMYARSSGVN
jgi:hypothetical protein